MRVCHCVGMLTNPGGVCCMDLPHSQRPQWVPQIPIQPPYKYTPPKSPQVVPHQPIKKIKSIEYYEDGTVKRIEYFDGS